MKLINLKPQIFLAFIMLFLFTAGQVTAGEKQNNTKLNQILEEISKTNPEIKSAIGRYKSVIAERSMATSGYKPVIGAEISAGPEMTDGQDTNEKREDFTASTATVYAKLNLYNGGNTSSYVKETDARILSAAYEVLNVTNRVFLDAAESYLNVLRASELVKLSRENVLTQEKILSQVREKANSGFNRISDLKNSEARLALSKSNYISRQQNLNQAIVKFHRQYGRFIDPDKFDLPKPVFEIPEDADETIDIALKNHPALKVAKYNIKVRKHSYEKSKSAYFPSLDLELKAQKRTDTGGDEGDTNQASAMLKLSYLFYDGGVRKSERTRAYENLVRENDISYVERRNVNETARLAWNILRAEAEKKKHLKDHVKLSMATLEAFKEEYHLGRRTLLDLLNMENEYYSAKNAMTESNYSYLIAYYRISSATGLLLHEYDNAVLKSLNLPEADFDVTKYKILNHNQDNDSVLDINDQCDNSIPGKDNKPYGCKKSDVFNLGYKSSGRFSPYIISVVGTPEELELKIDKRKKIQSVHIEALTFKSNSAELTDDAEEKLSFIADQLIAAQGFKTEIIGHTDNKGSKKYNMKLSAVRAENIYKKLLELGVEKDSMAWSGKGETEPVASNDNEDGRRKNRRTEFKIMKSQQEKI